MDPAIWIAVASALVAMLSAACGVALRSMSRTRLVDRLGSRTSPERMEVFLRKVPAMMLMTGMIRACMGLVLVLAVFHVIQGAVLDQSATLTVYLVTFLISGLIVSVFTVAIPFSWGKYHAEGLVVLSMPVLELLAWFFQPLLRLLHLFDPIVRRVSGVDLKEDDSDLSDEVLLVVEDHDVEGKVDEEQKEMLEAVFDLPDTDVADIMTPRTDIQGIEIDSDPEAVKEQLIASGHSRIPVYRESMDDIIGVLYAKDMIPLLGAGFDTSFKLDSLLREPYLVPESKPVPELLQEFKQRKVHLAIVLDEYGGTAGLVTIEDIFEELVGEIQDEYEEADEPEAVTQIDDTTAEVDARAHVTEVNDELDLDLPDDEDYDTLGGYVFAELGHVPEVGEAFERQGVRFTVIDAERTKVNRVRVEKVPSGAATNGER